MDPGGRGRLRAVPVPHPGPHCVREHQGRRSRFSTPVALRRQLEGMVRGTLITITYKGQESNRKMFDVVTSLCEG